MIVLKTQPAGADVYLDGVLIEQKTTATLNELLPATYNIRLELQGHYPWSSQIKVEQGKASLFEKIILFAKRTDIEQLNKTSFSSFYVDKEQKNIYSLDYENRKLYVSGLQGEHHRLAALVPKMSQEPLKFIISFDRKKVIFLNSRQVAVSEIFTREEDVIADQGIVLDYPSDVIVDAFWYSDNYHFMLVCRKRIIICEPVEDFKPVELASLSGHNHSYFYDISSDVLYFSDYQKAVDGQMHQNLYKLDVAPKVTVLPRIIKIKANE